MDQNWGDSCVQECEALHEVSIHSRLSDQTRNVIIKTKQVG
jgi:hypothetical protein